MERTELLNHLRQALPVDSGPASLPPGNVGLVVVDVVQGFTRFGALADADSMAPMVKALAALAKRLADRLGPRLHLALLRDAHHGDVPEPPYPPHCVRGTGEEELDPDIAHLADLPNAVVMDKDCINGFVGTLAPVEGGAWRSGLCDWIVKNNIKTVVLTGDCTDICVSDLAVALLSARNHGMLTALTSDHGEAYVEAIRATEIWVVAGACATFDFDPDAPLPHEQRTLRHPGSLAHHVGLWLMASRGARIVTDIAP